MNDAKIDHIEEYLNKKDDNFKIRLSRELFTGSKEDIDLKTDLGIEEIQLVAALIYNDIFLKSRGLKPVFSDFYANYFRLKVSLDRKSRGEFVKVNTNDNTDEFLQKAGNLQNVIGAKK